MSITKIAWRRALWLIFFTFLSLCTVFPLWSPIYWF